MRRSIVSLLLSAGALWNAAGCGGVRGGDQEVTVTRSALTVAADVFGFENPAQWSTTTAGVVFGSSTTRSQGSFSLQVRPSNSNGFTPIATVPLSTLAGVSPTLAWDVMLPTQQPNPSWFGTAQMYLNCPSRSISSAFLGQVELTGKPLNVWNTVSFPLANSTIASLLQAGYTDLTITVVLNVPVPTTGVYLVDNLRFVPAAANACGGRPNGTSCTDGNACTQTDTCQAGACQGANPVICRAQDQCHGIGTCNQATGLCSNPAVADGTTCTDGNACTRTDSCRSGVCAGANPVVCPSPNPCNLGICIPTSGACSTSPVADGTACDDGKSCTAADSCRSAMCVGTAVTDGTVCDDGNPSTQGETCQTGTCNPAFTVVPSLLGVVSEGSTYKAIFAYTTYVPGGVAISYGPNNGLYDDNNTFNPSPAQSPPTVFQPGPHDPFVAVIRGSQLTWTVQGRSVTATPGQAGTGSLQAVPAGDGTYVVALANGAQLNLDASECSGKPDWTACDGGDPCFHATACHSGVCGAGQTSCDDGNPCTVDSCAAATGACAHAAMPADQCTAAQSAGQALRARVDYVNQPDNNRCVPDPAHIINRLNANGELIAWHYSHPGYTPLDGQTFHTETIVRMPYFPTGPLDGSVFVSDWSHEKCDNAGVIGDCGAHLGVAEMGFKGGHNGRMLGTNRAYYDPLGPSVGDWNVAANPADTFFQIGTPPSPPFDPAGFAPTSHFNLDLFSPTQNHPGGASAIGHHIATALQAYDTSCGPFCIGPGCIDDITSCNPIISRGEVQIWDLAPDPLNPVQRSSFATFEDYDAVKAKGQGKDAVGVALTKLNTGHFLMVINTNSPHSQLEFYLSTGTSLDDPNLFGAPERAPDAAVAVNAGPGSVNDLRANPPNWQSLNFINGCDGSLWLLGSRDDQRYPGPDAIDSYRVLVGSSACNGYPLCVTMTYAADVVTQVGPNLFIPNSVGSKVLNCNDNAGRQECSFAAGGGSYVDPNGQVIVYGTRYDEDFYVGQPGFNDCNAGLKLDGTPFNYVAGRTTTNDVPCYPGTLHAKEFHERHGNLAIGTSCPTMDDAWVEFYSLGFFNDYGSDGSGQIRYVDYLSRLSQNPYFGANDFAGKAQSVRWCLPPGAGYEVFQGNQSGPYAVLNGTGTVAEIADLNVPGITLSDGAIANQRISSGIFVGSGDPVNGWNGVPDTEN